MMKSTLKFLALSSLMAFSALFQASTQTISPFANNQISVKLVLGEQATLPGYQGVNDETIYHRNVVTYTAAADSTLPTPTKPGTTFVSWVYAQSSALVRVNKMPRTSGATYYAYWQGDGSLATTIPSSSASSSSITTSSSIITSSEIVSTSTETFVPFNLYLLANTANVNWTEANAQIRLFFWNAPTTLEWPGTIMTDEGNGLYRYRFESFAPTNLLFVRLNPNNATEVWNQTIDLTYTTGQNLFTLTAWNNGEGKSTGTWSTYSPQSSSSIIPSSSLVTSSESVISSSESVMPSSSSTSASNPNDSSATLSSSSTMVSSTSSITISSASSETSSSLISESQTSSSSSTTMISSELSSIISSAIVSSETTSVVSSEQVSSSLPTSSVLALQYDVYLKVNDPSADWSQGNATFKLHYWGNGQNSDWNQLPSLTSLGNGIYHYAFMDYQPTHLLFQRRSADQNVIWNMTIDYSYPGDDAFLTITSWSSLEYCGDCLDKGTKSTGVWSTYSPA